MVTMYRGGGMQLWRYLTPMQGFQNKAATAGVPPATWLYVSGYSGHSNHLVTNKLTCHSWLVLQLLMRNSKHFETIAHENTQVVNINKGFYC